jgi:hypothetical protein
MQKFTRFSRPETYQASDFSRWQSKELYNKCSRSVKPNAVYRVLDCVLLCWCKKQMHIKELKAKQKLQSDTFGLHWQLWAYNQHWEKGSKKWPFDDWTDKRRNPPSLLTSGVYIPNSLFMSNAANIMQIFLHGPKNAYCILFRLNWVAIQNKSAY